MKVATTKHSVLNRLDSILRFDIFTTFISHIGQKTGLNRAVSSCIWQYSMSVLHGKQGYPTPAKRILHPILHPNMPLFTGSFTTRCRKCRIFFKNFFWGIPKLLPEKMIWGFENIGLLWGKHPYFRCKTSVLLPKEVRCFWFPETWFCRLFPANESYRLKQRNQQKHSYETVFEHYVDPQNEKFDKCRCKYRRNH